MDIFDEWSFKEYYQTVYAEQLKKIDEKLIGSYSGDERGFQVNKLRLDYFADFLTDYQYFDKTSGKVPFLETYKKTFLFLSDWEKAYTPDIKEDSDQAKHFRERRNIFRDIMSTFVYNIVNTFFMFNQDDDLSGVYHKYKKQGSQYYDLDALTLLGTFSRDYSLLLIDLITHDLNQRVSNVLRELLDRTKLLDRLQAICAKEWYMLSQEIQKGTFSPSPLLEIYFGRRAEGKPKSSYSHTRVSIPSIAKGYFLQIIDQKRLITQSPELTHMLKAEELLSITDVIKELLSELREGDEVIEDEALAIIEENRPLDYLSQTELREYLRQLLIDLPDFEYVRLKKLFRRKASQQTDLLTNIDSLYIHSIPSSLKSIEESLVEIHQNQTEILEQTYQLQTILESQFDLVIANQGKIEEYLFEKLGSDFEKIKHLWIKYKEKQLTGRQFIREATKILGSKFTRIVVGLVFLLK